MTSQTRQLFGTDGIRGVASEFPLTMESTCLIGRALGHDLIRTNPRASIRSGAHLQAVPAALRLSRPPVHRRQRRLPVHAAGSFTRAGLSFQCVPSPPRRRCGRFVPG